MGRSRRPKLGQHFLTDTRYCSRVVEALEPRPDDLVIEIGPGRGAVTGLLASRARGVVAIEVDAGLVDELRQKFQQVPKVEIIHGDVLLTDFGDICRRHNVSQCFVLGNLPYYITSPIIHRVLGFARSVRAMGLLVQREVADRLVAQPGTRNYGYLTVFTRLYSSARVVLQIPPGAFSPPPKVHSALVRFEMRACERSVSRQNEGEFLNFLKQSFAYKRKKFLNSLSPIYPRQRVEQELERLGLPTGVRAEQLSLEQLVAVFSDLR
jgi:16S rRNA (adenine1518-N6/adenine1519-N6)-dimethyltransferase